jgi:hypothetical protein
MKGVELREFGRDTGGNLGRREGNSRSSPSTYHQSAYPQHSLIQGTNFFSLTYMRLIAHVSIDTITLACFMSACEATLV